MSGQYFINFWMFSLWDKIKYTLIHKVRLKNKKMNDKIKHLVKYYSQQSNHFLIPKSLQNICKTNQFLVYWAYIAKDIQMTEKVPVCVLGWEHCQKLGEERRESAWWRVTKTSKTHCCLVLIKGIIWFCFWKLSIWKIML